MSAVADSARARIGPNSVLQLVEVLDARVGTAARWDLLAVAGIVALPPDTGLIPEAPVARLHQALRRHYPAHADALAREAGERTGDYILVHRIPALARRLLQVLPAAVAAPLLARAVVRHAWTFAGSGDFRIREGHALEFELFDNPIVRAERATLPVCHWHAAVFQRLFNALVSPDLHCVESECCATGAPACRFSLTRQSGDKAFAFASARVSIYS